MLAEITSANGVADAAIAVRAMSISGLKNQSIIFLSIPRFHGHPKPLNRGLWNRRARGVIYKSTYGEFIRIKYERNDSFDFWPAPRFVYAGGVYTGNHLLPCARW